MKTPLGLAILAMTALAPCAGFSSDGMSAEAEKAVAGIVADPSDAALSGALVSALRSEIESRGIGEVSEVVEIVLSEANSGESAEALASAVSTAAIQAAKGAGADLVAVGGDIGNGILMGTDLDYVPVAVGAAADAAGLASDSGDVADAVESVLLDDVPTADSDGTNASQTPVIDISIGTGVSH